MNQKEEAFQELLHDIMKEQDQPFARGHISAIIDTYLTDYHKSISWENIEPAFEEITGKPLTKEEYEHIILDLGWEGIDNDIRGFIEARYRGVN